MTKTKIFEYSPATYFWLSFKYNFLKWPLLHIIGVMYAILLFILFANGAGDRFIFLGIFILE